jgi:hypothetical protein
MCTKQTNAKLLTRYRRPPPSYQANQIALSPIHSNVSSLQVTLKSKTQYPLAIHFFILPGPFSDMKVSTRIYKHDFTDNENETSSSFNLLPLPDTAEVNRLLAAKTINFRWDHSQSQTTKPFKSSHWFQIDYVLGFELNPQKVTPSCPSRHMNFDPIFTKKSYFLNFTKRCCDGQFTSIFRRQFSF